MLLGYHPQLERQHGGEGLRQDYADGWATFSN